MDINLSRLIAAARRIDARITPTRRDDGFVVLTGEDVRALTAAVTRASFSSVDGNRIRGLLTAQRPAGERALPDRESLMLTSAINRLALSADRARRIDRGQIPGSMSSSEAVRLMRRLGRL